MTRRPYQKIRTRTPRVKQARHKLEREILKLTDIREAIRYDPETGLFYERSKILTRKLEKGVWHPIDTITHENPVPVGRMDKDGYIVIQWGGKSYQAQRLAYFLRLGKWPTFYMRHKNGLRFDNRECNIGRAGVKK